MNKTAGRRARGRARPVLCSWLLSMTGRSKREPVKVADGYYTEKNRCSQVIQMCKYRTPATVVSRWQVLSVWG